MFKRIFLSSTCCYHVDVVSGRTNHVQDTDVIVTLIPRLPWIYHGKPHLSGSLRLRPWDQVVFYNKITDDCDVTIAYMYY